MSFIESGKHRSHWMCTHSLRDILWKKIIPISGGHVITECSSRSPRDDDCAHCRHEVKSCTEYDNLDRASHITSRLSSSASWTAL